MIVCKGLPIPVKDWSDTGDDPLPFQIASGILTYLGLSHKDNVSSGKDNIMALA